MGPEPGDRSAARCAREALDTDLQLRHAAAACGLFERSRGESERALAGLLEATGLEVDARGAVADHAGARDRATQTIELLRKQGATPQAVDVAARYHRRSREVAGEADAVMREAMAAHLVLRPAPIDRRQRDVESLSALTTVLSAAHRLGTAGAIKFAGRALEWAPPLRAHVETYDERVAARHSTWTGIFLASHGENLADAGVHLDRYLAWADRVPTKRNQLLSLFALGERELCARERGSARETFRAALAETETVLPRKNRAAAEILARRGVV